MVGPRNKRPGSVKLLGPVFHKELGAEKKLKGDEKFQPREGQKMLH